MKPTVLLFDVDGTLMDSGGAGRRAIERAFDARYGRADACASIRFGGMTDLAIMREALVAIGESVTSEVTAELLAIYLRCLEDELARAEDCVVYPGVHEVLVAVRSWGAAVGLGTGNVREGARLKLSRVGLYHRFAFGGFGCDHELRAEVLRAGAERGAAIAGAPVAECRVVVIGDTPKDIAAARAIGAQCLAVATGSFDRGALAAHDPTWVFDTLAHEGVMRALAGE